MRFTLRYFAVAGALTVAISTGTHADGALSSLPRDLILQLGPGVRVERLVAVGLMTMRHYDRDENGLDAVDIDAAPKHQNEQLRQLLQADPNNDGHLAVGELEASIRTTFAKLDVNGNGVLDDTEYALVSGDVEMANIEARVEAELPYCSLPKSVGDNDVVAVTVERGDAQPTVTVMGQSDTTYLARIVVEPGERPLYVLLSADQGTVWKFEGQVDRLSQVVVIPTEVREPDAINGGWAGAGVLGVPKDIVTFTRVGACGSSYYEGVDRKVRASVIAKVVGVPSVLAFGGGYPQGFSIPSGTPMAKAKARDIITTESGTYSVIEGEPPEPYRDGFTLKAQEDWRATWGGIVEVKPEEVIAPGKVETYEVLPGADGLRYLVENGVLARTENGYRVLKPLPRWPAGLRTLDNLTFILPEGMPRPKGSPGHADVIEEP